MNLNKLHEEAIKLNANQYNNSQIGDLIVLTKEYIDWIYDFVLNHKQLNTKSLPKNLTDDDLSNLKLLGQFFNHIRKLAIKQHVEIKHKPEHHGINDKFIIKIRNHYFEVFSEFNIYETYKTIILLDYEPEKYVEVKY